MNNIYVAGTIKVGLIVLTFAFGKLAQLSWFYTGVSGCKIIAAKQANAPVNQVRHALGVHYRTNAVGWMYVTLAITAAFISGTI